MLPLTRISRALKKTESMRRRIEYGLVHTNRHSTIFNYISQHMQELKHMVIAGRRTQKAIARLEFSYQSPGFDTLTANSILGPFQK
jgi:hypothetical protein